MRRRELLLGLSSVFMLGRGASAQQRQPVPRIGYLTSSSGSPENIFGVLQTRALVEELRKFGWFDGRNVTIDHRFSGRGRERMARAARELVASSPDVILAIGGAVLAAVVAETRTIPIVFTNADGPVAGGAGSGLTRPGGNLTGFGGFDTPIAGKRVQLLKETAPQLGRVLVLMAAENPQQRVDADAALPAAQALGMSPILATVGEIEDYRRELAAFARAPGGGLVVLPNAVADNNLDKVHALAAEYRLPAIYSDPANARTGGLMSYGPDNLELIRRAAGSVDKILRGANPGDLPVEQPSRLILAVNLRAAKALGLGVPQSVLARADEVIE